MIIVAGEKYETVPKDTVQVEDYIQYVLRGMCTRRIRQVVRVNLGRKHKYVMVSPTEYDQRTNNHKVQFADVTEVWRKCEVQEKQPEWEETAPGVFERVD